LTLSAGDTRFDGYMIIQKDIRHVFTSFDYCPCRFVSKHMWKIYDFSTILPMLIIVEVRPTDTDAFDTDENLVSARYWTLAVD
jgi:hypothetical protein